MAYIEMLIISAILISGIVRLDKLVYRAQPGLSVMDYQVNFQVNALSQIEVTYC